MPDDDEINEVSVLFQKLNNYFEKLSEMHDTLDDYFNDYKIIFQCADCKLESDSKMLSCSACKSSHIMCVLRLIGAFKRKTEINDSPVREGFEDGVAKLFPMLVRYYRGIITGLHSASGINIFKDLDLAPNCSLEEAYVRIFMFMTYKYSVNYEKDVNRIKDVMKYIETMNQKVKTTFDRLQEIVVFSERTKSEYDKLFAFIFDETSDLSKLVEDITGKIDTIKNSPVLINIYQTCKKRQSLNIDPHAINPQLSGRITVNVRHLIDEKFDSMVTTCRFFLHGIRIFGSAEKYYGKVIEVLGGAIEDLLKYHPQLFVDVYGPRINVSIYLDIETYKYAKGVAGFVGEAKEYAYSAGKTVCVSKYDPSLRILEINIVAGFLLGMLQTSNITALTDILIHEITHLFDLKLIDSKRRDNAQRIRDEGIARFSEFAYGGQNPKFFYDIILAHMERPLSTGIGYIIMEEVPEHDMPYILGDFICFVIYLALVKRRFGITINVLNPGFEKEILQNPELFEYAQIVLRLIKQMSVKDFFRFYLKYSSELGLKPIVTEAYAESVY